MKERPILFQAAMVRAILAGAKTETRRVVDPQPAHGCRYEMNGAGTHALHLAQGGEAGPVVFVPPTPTSRDARLPCPYGVPGDRLWVKETWRPRRPDGTAPFEDYVRVEYAAGGEPRMVFRQRDDDRSPRASEVPCAWKWPRAARTGNVSPLFLPRWASRLTLEIAAVRVERLHELSEQAARAEGMEPDVGLERSCRASFVKLWDEIHWGRFPWVSNPFVWVVAFRRMP